MHHGVDGASRVVSESLSLASLTLLLDAVARQLPVGASLAAQRQQRLVHDSRGGGGVWLLRRPRCAEVLACVVDDDEGDDDDVQVRCRVRPHEWWQWHALLRPWLCAAHTRASAARRARGGASLSRLVDGHARVLLLLRALVSSLLVTHDADTASALCATATRLAQSHSRARRLRVVAALRALVSPCGVCCHARVANNNDNNNNDNDGEEEEEEDWCAYLVRRVVCRLQRSDDFVRLHTLPHVDDVVRVIDGALHHLLASEVAEDVRDVLRSLLVRYLVPGPPYGDAPSSAALLCATMRVRLTQLVRDAASVFVCSRSAAVRDDNDDTLPPCAGAVRASRLVPAHVLVLPTSHTRVSAWRSPAPRTPLLDLRSSNNNNNNNDDSDDDDSSDKAADAATVAVAFVRIDPAGDWLDDDDDGGSSVTAHNTRSFYRYYANDTNDGSDNDDDDDFYTMHARSAGVRHVACASQDGSTNDDEEEEEDDVQRVVQCLWRLMHGGSSNRNDRDRSARLQLAAAVRLFAWAADEGVRVVLTPERVPALLKRFGERHMHLLQCLRGASSSNSGDRRCTTTATTATATTVHVVDELRVDAFAHALRALDADAAVLSRGRLRVPRASATMSSAVGGSVVWLSRVTVMTATRFVRSDGDDVYTTCQQQQRQNDTSEAVTWTHDDCVCLLVRATSSSALPRGPAWLRAAAALSQPPSLQQTQQQQHDTQLHDAARQQPPPRILLVAPTQHHVTLYEQLLCKAAAALRAALVSDDDDDSDGSSAAAACCRARTRGDLRGLVRAGGAVYVALARELRTLAQYVCMHASADNNIDNNDNNNNNSRVPSWLRVVYADPVMLQYVLNGLATACLSVTTHLATAVVHDRATADVTACAHSDVTRDRAAAVAVWSRGPHARQRLWWHALSHAMSPSATHATAHRTPHELHVYHASVDELLAALTPRRCRRGSNDDDAHATTTPLSPSAETAAAEAAIWHVFGRDVCECNTCRACRTRWCFVEPLHSNVHALLAAMQALVTVCSAAA